MEMKLRPRKTQKLKSTHRNTHNNGESSNWLWGNKREEEVTEQRHPEMN
jgi:hypothetical protein